jgi:hypothetical protein
MQKIFFKKKKKLSFAGENVFFSFQKKYFPKKKGPLNCPFFKTDTFGFAHK